MVLDGNQTQWCELILVGTLSVYIYREKRNYRDEHLLEFWQDEEIWEGMVERVIQVSVLNALEDG